MLANTLRVSSVVHSSVTTLLNKNRVCNKVLIPSYHQTSRNWYGVLPIYMISSLCCKKCGCQTVITTPYLLGFLASTLTTHREFHHHKKGKKRIHKKLNIFSKWIEIKRSDTHWRRYSFNTQTHTYIHEEFQGRGGGVIIWTVKIVLNTHLTR